MIFHKDKILFLHPGKTGGTTIESFLVKKYLNIVFTKLDPKKSNYDIMYGYCKVSRIYLQHADLRFLNKKNIGIASDYLKLVSIRCPYNKILSAYYYNSLDRLFSFKDFIEKELSNRINYNITYAKNHFCPQVYYYKEDFHIIKLENITEDCAKHNIFIDKIHIAKTKASNNYKDYLDAYDHKMIDIVNNLYKEDFLTFDYRIKK